MDSQAHKFQIASAGEVEDCPDCDFCRRPPSCCECHSCGKKFGVAPFHPLKFPDQTTTVSRLPYAVQYGPACSESATFATFGEALAFWRGFNAGKSYRITSVDPAKLFGHDDGPRIVNTDRLDGAEDGNPSGLTEDEREQLREAE